MDVLLQIDQAVCMAHIETAWKRQRMLGHSFLMQSTCRCDEYPHVRWDSLQEPLEPGLLGLPVYAAASALGCIHAMGERPCGAGAVLPGKPLGLAFRTNTAEHDWLAHILMDACSAVCTPLALVYGDEASLTASQGLSPRVHSSQDRENPGLQTG